MRNATALIATFCVIGLITGSSSSAAAEAPKLLWTKCETGSGAGQCQVPRGIAADPTSGHVYVADQGNSRIDEFTAWGEFVKTWGWDVVASGPDDSGTGFEVCVPANGDTCQAGTKGGGSGQLSAPQGVALDSSGNVYVVDFSNHRVQKFSPSGQFQLMFGGAVNKTKVEATAPEAEQNVCPVAPGDVCQAGTTGGGKGQFGAWKVGSFIAIDPSNRVYVGDVGRIQRFDTGGAYQADLPDPQGLLSERTVQSLATDALGNLYVAFFEEGLTDQPDARKLNPAGISLITFKVPNPRAIAVDPTGNVYVFDANAIKLLQFSSAGNQVEEFGDGLSETPTGIGTGSGCGIAGADVYISNSTSAPSFVRAFGPPPDVGLCPPPPSPPEIKSQYAVTVDIDTATVRAEINPRFWPDTSYYVEYGSGQCSGGGCEEQAGFPGIELGAGAVDDAITSSGVVLSGLQPDTTYHYRFVAESSGGGPVHGVGAEEAEASFRTPPSPLPAKTSCPNQAFRSEGGNLLPDCRAYEMVSPLDKANGDILVLANNNNNPTSLDQSARGGGKLTYSSYNAFGDSQSAPYVSQYIATRTEGGWSSEAISPPRGRTLIAISGLDNQFKAFSEDLAESWLLYDSNRELAPGAVHDFANVYRRDNTSGSYEALLPIEPPHREAVEFVPELQGTSADGEKAIFTANDRLAVGAPELGSSEYSLYEAGGGELRYACVLPGEIPYSGPCTAGTANNQLPEGRNNTVSHTISADGSRVFWTASGGEGPGKIYVRIGGTKTLPVSETGEALSGTTESRYWTAAADGSKAIFTTGGDLYEFEIGSEETTLISHNANGVLGASDDASRIYFLSEAALTGEEENSEGAKAQAGKPNLYLYRAGETVGAGTYAFIATLSAVDGIIKSVGSIRTPVNVEPIFHSAYASPDGGSLTFMSSGQPTAFDNTDASSGQSDAEVYIYNAGSNKLACVSCNPTGARPSGANINQVGGFPPDEGHPFWAVAQLPGWTSQLYAPRVLSADGSRLFFESFESLTPHDTNGKQDVYEWERAGGRAECEEMGAESFSPTAGGCLSLISSGEAPTDSEFVDASSNGADVFFKTAASLLPQDPGLVDIYDARVNGGLPPPPGPKPECEGQACQSPAAPPPDITPASSAFHGAGNVTRRGARQRCRRGRHSVRRHGKVRCVRTGKRHRRGTPR